MQYDYNFDVLISMRALLAIFNYSSKTFIGLFDKTI